MPWDHLYSHSDPRPAAEIRVRSFIMTTYLYARKLTNDRPQPFHPLRSSFPISCHVFQTIARVENIQRVRVHTIHIQTPNQPALGKCHNLIMATPYGSLLGFHLGIPAECMRPPASPPHSPTSSVSSSEMWVISSEAVSICCFPQVARWAGGS